MLTLNLTARSASALEMKASVRYLACGMILLGIMQLVLRTSFSSFHSDFSHYYIGGSLFAAGDNPYTTHLERLSDAYSVPYDPMIPYAAHPPLILLLFAQLSQFSMPIAYGIWLVFQLCCVGACVELTRRILDFSWRDTCWLLLVAFFLNSIAVRQLIYFSQVQLAVGALAYAALYSNLRGRHCLACALIVVAAAFKIFPAVLLPWFLLAGVKTWRSIFARLATMALVATLCLLLPGSQAWIDFLTLGLPSLTANAAIWTNYSIQNFVASMARASFHLDSGHASEPVVAVLPKLGSLVVIALAMLIVAIRRLPARESFCILLMAATVGGFIAWTHYMTLMLLPIALLVRHAVTHKSAASIRTAAIICFLVLMPHLDEIFVNRLGILRSASVVLHFYPLYSIGCLAILLIAQGEYSRRKETSESQLLAA